MVSQAMPPFSPEEYLEIERGAVFKSEYIDGCIIPKAGANEPHNLIVTNMVAELRTQLKGRDCRVYSNATIKSAMQSDGHSVLFILRKKVETQK